jgi:hypothetical protein
VSYSIEFETVDLLANSSAETRGVDAFSLSLIKAERQLRRLFTFGAYQFPCFGAADIPQLREALGSERVYFEGFERGFNNLFPRTVEHLVGRDYARLRSRIDEAIDYRNKIFHGQLTPQRLTRGELLAFVTDIRMWCEALATAAGIEFGYDGFGRDSFRKSPNSDLAKAFRVQFVIVADYSRFIQLEMLRY